VFSSGHGTKSEEGSGHAEASGEAESNSEASGYGSEDGSHDQPSKLQAEHPVDEGHGKTVHIKKHQLHIREGTI
jgi:hypothetical protein